MLGVGLDGTRPSGPLTLEASSVQTAPDGSRLIVWMINGMIKGHPNDTGRAFRLRAAAPPGEGAPAPADQPAGELSKVNQAPGLSRRGAMVSPPGASGVDGKE
jgi:hypothetical protein